jgi:NAD-dependent deacetylase
LLSLCCSLLKGEADPPCAACGGVLLPDVVHFGAALDSKLLEVARTDVAQCDLLIAIGSSFFVEPANTLPGPVILRRTPFVLLNKR